MSLQSRGCNPWVVRQQARTHHVLKPPKRSPFETMWLALAPVPGSSLSFWGKGNKQLQGMICQGCQEWTCKHDTTKLTDQSRNINIHHTKVAPQLCTRQKDSKGTCRPEQGSYTSKKMLQLKLVKEPANKNLLFINMNNTIYLKSWMDIKEGETKQLRMIGGFVILRLSGLQSENVMLICCLWFTTTYDRKFGIKPKTMPLHATRFDFLVGLCLEAQRMFGWCIGGCQHNKEFLHGGEMNEVSKACHVRTHTSQLHA